jgi:hypothetical protein
METFYPLKTLILNRNPEEIDALKKFTRKFPRVFNVHRISGEFFDTLLILNTESFDLTFFDETVFPIDLIEKFGKHRFGIIVFKDKKTVSWKLNIATKGDGYFAFEPPFDKGSSVLIKEIQDEATRVYSQQHYTKPATEPKLQFQVGAKTYFISPSDIICIKVTDKLSRIYYDDDGITNVIPQWTSLGEFESLFDSKMFFRSDRNFIINLEFIKTIIDSDGVVVLSRKFNGKNITANVSYRRLRELRKIRK